jgi:peptidyl-prolyl cis-trans isomerase C
MLNVTSPQRVPNVNGVALLADGETLSHEELRQRACTELLRQAAQSAGLLPVDDEGSAFGIPSAAAADAIDTLLDQALQVPEPTEEACRRRYAAHEATYRTGERVHLRHILFAVTPGVDVTALRKRAEACLLDVRCHAAGDADGFAGNARELSNCPSGELGGDLGWLTRDDCAPEFAREVFGQNEIGVLPRLVHSRFGLHVVEVVARQPGQAQPFESVRGAVAASLRQHTQMTAVRQYLRLLAGQAQVEGVDLDTAETPLVQ